MANWQHRRGKSNYTVRVVCLYVYIYIYTRYPRCFGTRNVFRLRLHVTRVSVYPCVIKRETERARKYENIDPCILSSSKMEYSICRTNRKKTGREYYFLFFDTYIVEID